MQALFLNGSGPCFQQQRGGQLIDLDAERFEDNLNLAPAAKLTKLRKFGIIHRRSITAVKSAIMIVTRRALVADK